MTIFKELKDFTTVREIQLALVKLGKVISRQRVDLELKGLKFQTMRLNRINIYRIQDGIDYIQRKVKANKDNIEVIILKLKESNNE